MNLRFCRRRTARRALQGLLVLFLFRTADPVSLAGQAAANGPAEPFDRQAASSEALGLLKELIRFRTVNPPGNEAELLRHVAGVLRKDGIDSEIVEPEPGRGVLKAVLKGDGSKPAPLLLLAHVDVVGVEEGKWSMDPFEAVEKEGFLYGRGVIDDKGMAAAAVETMLLIKRSGEGRARDLILILEGDEEAGGKLGIEWVLKNRPDWLRGAAFALNEGGRVMAAGEGGGGPSGPAGPRGVRWVGVQNVEKIPFSVDIIARGPSGHASMPRDVNAILRLAAALAKLAEHHPLPRLIPETREFFHDLASVSPKDEAEHLAAVVDIIRESGIRTNVIPAEARATINCRILPDTPPATFIEELKQAAGDEGLEWKLHEEPEAAPAASPMDSDLVRAIATAARSLWKGVPVLPLLSTGATDSQALRRAGIPSYGLLPFPLGTDDLARMHGNDERVPLAAFADGVELLYRSVRQALR
ncbi:MAG: hypothetical protein DMF49_03200 [Acidobacteria bacterium]|nr:MAG: hypothetical protein DMF49_03200 [Acidobacteriota bacterium]